MLSVLFFLVVASAQIIVEYSFLQSDCYYGEFNGTVPLTGNFGCISRNSSAGATFQNAANGVVLRSSNDWVNSTSNNLSIAAGEFSVEIWLKPIAGDEAHIVSIGTFNLYLYFDTIVAQFHTTNGTSEELIFERCTTFPNKTMLLLVVNNTADPILYAGGTTRCLYLGGTTYISPRINLSGPVSLGGVGFIGEIYYLAVHNTSLNVTYAASARTPNSIPVCVSSLIVFNQADSGNYSFGASNFSIYDDNGDNVQSVRVDSFGPDVRALYYKNAEINIGTPENSSTNFILSKGEDTAESFSSFANVPCVSTFARLNYTVSDHCGLEEDCFFPVSCTLNMCVREVPMLAAGCGVGATAAYTPCRGVGKEDNSVNVTLKGYDGNLTHTNNSRRFYRLNSIPSEGELFEAGKIVDYAPLQSGVVIQALNATGFIDLVYFPLSNYFNGLCGLNRNPPTTGALTTVNCPGVYQDGMGLGFEGCETSTGCPITFSFSIGYQDDEVGLIFSPPYAAGAELIVMGVNDGPLYFEGPTAIYLELIDTFYSLLELSESQTPFHYEDNDGDTYRIGFAIDPPYGFNLRLPEDFYNPNVSSGNRITFFSGTACYLVSCNEPISGRAYKTDLNRIFDEIRISTFLLRGNATLIVKIWDPVSNPGSLETNQIIFSSEPETLELSVKISYGVGIGIVNQVDLTLSGVIWFSIALAGLFLICLCYCGCSPCIGAIFSGIGLARWIVRNLLSVKIVPTTSINMKEIVDEEVKLLEKENLAQHKRITRLLCCALCVQRICPCCCRRCGGVKPIPDADKILEDVLRKGLVDLEKRKKPL